MAADPENPNFRYLLRQLQSLRAQEKEPAGQRALDRAIAETEKAFVLPRFDSEATGRKCRICSEYNCSCTGYTG